MSARLPALLLAVAAGAAASISAAGDVAAGTAAGAAAAEPSARFFVAGDGTLGVQSVRFGDRAAVRYRRADGTYDAQALGRIARVLRSGDGRVGPLSARAVELLARVQALAGGAPLRVVSGYRSPAYNDHLRQEGHKAASGSLHTEGMAADLAFDPRRLEPLWHAVRALDCCGAGLYLAQGFLHVDVGPSRFWEAATSRVDENLSAGNARLFARTEFDRYAHGEPITVSLHAMTAPPVWIARTATVVDAGDGRALGDGAVEASDGDDAAAPGCIEADARTRLRVRGAPPVGRGLVVLHTCPPRPERTPDEVRTNALEVR